jgi:hypothetical protein
MPEIDGLELLLIDQIAAVIASELEITFDFASLPDRKGKGAKKKRLLRNAAERIIKLIERSKQQNSAANAMNNAFNRVS